MNLDSIRRHCLSFPQATENLQWGEELCFKINGKIFAAVSLGGVPQTLVFKCNPEKFAELLENEDIIPAPYVGRYKWVMLQRLDVLPLRELEDLLTESFEMVVAKSPKKRKSSKHKTSRKRVSKAKRR